MIPRTFRRFPRWCALWFFLSLLTARGEVKLHGLFTDHLVLQRGTAVPIWGWADDGEEVTVLRRAVFGGPLHLRAASGGEFAVARELAEKITVTE